MADLCVDLVPLFTALPQDEKIKLDWCNIKIIKRVR